MKINFFPELSIIQTEINRVFKRFLTLPDHMRIEDSSWVPLVDCYETEDHLVYKIEVPGVKKDSIKVEIRSDYLYVEGIKPRIRETCRTRFTQIERSFGRFSRYIPISTAVDLKSANGYLKSGMLMVKFSRIIRDDKLSVPIHTGKE